MYEELKKYTKEVKSFHMPGHKNGKLQLITDVYKVDVTEVPGTDDLHHPTGIIDDVQKKIACIYKSENVYLLTNGSTGGILATIATLAAQEGSVLVARNCHKSVYNGLLIQQLNAYYIYPKYHEEYGYYGEIKSQDIEYMLEKYPDIHSVILTSPTYEGIVSDIKAISQIVHAYGARLLVDEAHGAHFTFSEILPKSAVELGADYVIQSTHKTLPCLTQTAILHSNIKNNNRLLEENLSIYQSSSPSYILMSSIEKGIDYMHNYRVEFNQWIKELIKLLDKHPIYGGRWLNKPNADQQYQSVNDCTRLTLLIEKENISGYALSKKLRETHGIQVEMAEERYIVAIITMADSMDDIERFIKCINESIVELSRSKNVLLKEKKVSFPRVKPEQYMAIYEAKKRNDYEKIGYKQSLHCIAKGMIIPYPPGIPIILPGEKITQEIIDYLESLDKRGKEIYGIIKGEIDVLKEKK